MRTAIALRNIVGETQDVLVIAVIPLQRRLDGHAVLFADRVDRLGNDCSPLAIKVLDERLHPAIILQDDLIGLNAAQILEHDLCTGIQEGQLAQAMLQRGAVIFGHGEGFR